MRVKDKFEKYFIEKSSMNGILKRDAHKQEPLSSCQIRKTNSILQVTKVPSSFIKKGDIFVTANVKTPFIK